MPYKTPPEIAAAGVASGVTKSGLSCDKALVAGFLGGAYIAVAGLLAIVVSAGLDPASWGGNTVDNWLFAFLGNLVGAAVFVGGAYWYLYVRGVPENVPAERGAAEWPVENGRPHPMPTAPAR